MSTAKDEARELIDALPDQASWDDIMYEFYVKNKPETALNEAVAGEVVSHESAKRELNSRGQRSDLRGSLLSHARKACARS